ncbi:hypothetical protein UFOVP274_58 [uncultured Caudovirales phage]|uniref:Uncharacterized protein n=1 Tax=uncultured Caudovirales phage TaxID=2100421 RepID=A0A6J5LNV0_9CAUD|nr:hypothetical protein UFOVP274_58 [uncultured Caudovirales phage]
MTKVVLSLFLLFVGNAFAEEWTDQEKAALVVSSALLVMDWNQTRRIATEKIPRETWHGREFARWEERNPIIGTHPSIGRVNNYFAAALIGNYLIADALDNRMYWLVGVGLLEFAVVLSNKRVGVSWSFK